MDLARVRRELTDPARGFSLTRAFYSPPEIERYLKRALALVETGPVLHAQVVHDRQRDYVFPRTSGRVLSGYQAYQFLHNHRKTPLEAFFRRAIEFRNEVEREWADDAYRAECAPLRDYVQVNYYLEGTGKLDRHIDQKPNVRSLLLQPWVSLTEPGEDYTQGNLIIHSRDGTSHRVEEELDVHRGDLLLFDRSLWHEVERTAGGHGRQPRSVQRRYRRAPGTDHRTCGCVPKVPLRAAGLLGRLGAVRLAATRPVHPRGPTGSRPVHARALARAADTRRSRGVQAKHYLQGKERRARVNPVTRRRLTAGRSPSLARPRVRSSRCSSARATPALQYRRRPGTRGPCFLGRTCSR